jgi:hypothetical protein
MTKKKAKKAVPPPVGSVIMAKKKGKKPVPPPEGAVVLNKVLEEAGKILEAMEPEVRYCVGCRAELSRIKWKPGVEMYVCETEGCPRWRQPQGYFKQEVKGEKDGD